MKRIPLLLILAALTIGGCQKPIAGTETDATEETGDTGDPGDNDIDESDPSGTGNDDPVDVGGSVEEELDESEYTTAIDIVWNGTSASVTNGSSLKIS